MAGKTSLNSVQLLPRPRRVQQHGLGKQFDLLIQEGIDSSIGHPQGYHLSIDIDGNAKLIGSDPAGLFYARQTLAQIQRQFKDVLLPVVTIQDWPDFLVRGYMLDISRDKVPTMQTLFEVVDQLAELKINQLQLYTEHTFAYRAHELVWKEASPMTAAEIQALDQYCRERFIELVPNQNSFGHLERWFKHPEYQHLAEQPAGFVFPWGNRMPTGFSLNPTDPQSLAFVESLFDELLPNFTSKLFNVGCDETFDIGLGRSKEQVEKLGRERVYLDFLLKIYQAVIKRGRQMMFWGDIILHKPELLGELPRDIIALNWGYEADHPFETETQAFRDAGIPFYVCPGTSTWCSISGRSDNAIANLQSAAKHGLKNGAAGYLITDWGDHGHLQYLSTSFLPLAAGAAYAWSLESNQDLSSLLSAVDQYIFQDEARVMATLMYELGNVALAMKEPIKNATALFWTLINGEERKKLYENVTAEEYADAEMRTDAALRGLDQSLMNRSDNAIILGEVRNTANMLHHACRRGRYLRDPGSIDVQSLAEQLKATIAEHRSLWRARNREGGLKDSAARLERIAMQYEV